MSDSGFRWYAAKTCQLQEKDMSAPNNWSDAKLAGMKKLIEEEQAKRKPKPKAKPTKEEGGGTI